MIHEPLMMNLRRVDGRMDNPTYIPRTLSPKSIQLKIVYSKKGNTMAIPRRVGRDSVLGN